MIEALIFDVFGTCVDWRNSVARDVCAEFPDVDAHAFADHWRGLYQPAMETIRSGSRDYVKLDELHLMNLRDTCATFAVSPRHEDDLNRAWERLDPWSDVVPGLTMIKRGHIIAPCSNGSIGLMTRLAKYGGLPWDAILGADIAHDYKPKPITYLASCDALQCRPERVVMVAAHNDDLAAARAAGLKTAFVTRPTEHGPNQTTDLEPSEVWDIIATDFIDLARQLT